MEEINYQPLSIFGIIGDSFRKSFNNFKPFLKFFAYPVFGQIIGLFIALIPAIVLPALLIAGAGASASVVIALVALSLIIGLPLFCHAFWKCMVRTAASYIIAKELILKNKLMDFKVAEDMIYKRAGSYVGLLLWLTLIGIIIYIVGYILLYIAFGGAIVTDVKAGAGMYYTQQFILQAITAIMMIPFSLSYSAFSLNPEFLSLPAIKKSLALINKKFIKTLLFLAAISAVFFIIAIPMILLLLIPIVGFIAVMLIAIIFIPLYVMLYTHWYLKLEAEKAYENQITN